MESIENIRLVHADCVKSFHFDFPNNYFLNKYVKLKFLTPDDRAEHCWVFVKTYDNDSFYGTLSNEPMLDIGVVFGDEIKFARSEIEDVCV